MNNAVFSIFKRNMSPKIIKGNCYSDSRGKLFYNNDFDASSVKRVYVIENHCTDFIRAWQGHKIEQRWFLSIQGSFKIQLIRIDNWENPSKASEQFDFVLEADKMNVLHIPKGYVNSIQSLEEGSKLLVMSDYLMNEIQDEYRYPLDYFRD